MSDNTINIHADGGDRVIDMKQVGLAMSSIAHVDEAVRHSKTRNFKDQLIPFLYFIILTVIPGLHSYYQDWNEYQHEAIQIIQTVNDFIETGKVNTNHP